MQNEDVVLKEADKQAEEILIQESRNNINIFAEYCFIDQETLEPLIQQGFHKEWHKFLDSNNRSIIEAPREHGKTEQIAIIRTIWKLGRNPNRRIKIICQSDSKASQRLQAIKTHIEQNEKIHKVFPNLRRDKKLDVWSTTQIIVVRQIISKDPSVEALGILSSGSGGRADELIFDDVVDFRNSIQNPSMRKTIKESFRSVWSNMISKSGTIEYICTPWHDDDLTHELKRNSEYKVKSFPIVDFKSIWEDKWPKERLVSRYKEIGSRSYARSFTLVALSAEDQTFRHWGIPFKEILPLSIIKPEWSRFMGCDPFGQNTAISIAAVDEDERRYLIKVWRGQRGPAELVTELLTLNEAYKPDLILVENNAAQEAILQWAQEKSDSLTVEGFHTGSQKMKLDIGLPSLDLEFEQNKWRICSDETHDVDCRCDLCELKKELAGHPVYKTQDIVMSLWLAQSAIRQMTSGKMRFV